MTAVTLLLFRLDLMLFLNSDVLLSTSIFAGDGEGGSGFAAAAAAATAGGVSSFDFGVDPNLDPELALALRVSMEEDRARQEAASKRLQMVLLSKRKKGSLLHKMQPCVKMLGLLNLRIKNNDLMGSSKNEESYRLAGLVESVVGSLRWEFPAVNRQPFDWECGFYVMKWMQDFVLKYQNDNFPNIVPWSDERLLENKELNAWCMVYVVA